MSHRGTAGVPVAVVKKPRRLGFSSLSSASPLVFSVPMFLLALGGAVSSVPAAPVDRFSLAVVALEEKKGVNLC